MKVDKKIKNRKKLITIQKTTGARSGRLVEQGFIFKLGNGAI